MRAVILLTVGMLAQLAFAIFVAKCMRFGLGPRASDADERAAAEGMDVAWRAESETEPAYSGTDSRADLAGLLIALRPQQESADARETAAEPVLAPDDRAETRTGPLRQ